MESIRGILKGSSVQASPIKAVYQGLFSRFAAASSCSKTSSDLGHWCPEDSLLFVPWQGITSNLLLVDFLVVIRADGLPLAGGANLVSHPTCWRARLSWLPWVAGAATKGRLEVMDGLLEDLPLSALSSIEL